MKDLISVSLLITFIILINVKFSNSACSENKIEFELLEIQPDKLDVLIKYKLKTNLSNTLFDNYFTNCCDSLSFYSQNITIHYNKIETKYLTYQDFNVTLNVSYKNLEPLTNYKFLVGFHWIDTYRLVNIFATEFMTCFSNPNVPDVIINNTGNVLTLTNSLSKDTCYFEIEIKINNRIYVLNETKQVFLFFNETFLMKSIEINVTAFTDVVCLIDEYPNVKQCKEKVLASSKFSYKYSPMVISNTTQLTTKHELPNDLSNTNSSFQKQKPNLFLAYAIVGLFFYLIFDLTV